MRGGPYVILVSFFPDHRLGCRSPGIFEHRGGSSRDRKNAVRGIPGLIPRFSSLWTTSNLGPVNVRVAPVLTYSVLNHEAPLESR